MNERELSVRRSHARRQEFIVSRIEQGLAGNNPGKFSSELWERKVNVGVAYNLGNGEVNYDVLGKAYERTDELMRLDNADFLTTIWRRSDADTRKEYPLEEILFTPKPRSMKEKTPKEKSSVRAFLCRIRNIYDDSEVQRQFDEVPATALIRYKGDSGGEANEIARLRDTVKDSFRYFPRHSSLFYDAVGRSGIPARKASLKGKRQKGKYAQNYYLHLARDSQRILQALLADESLARFRVQSSTS